MSTRTLIACALTMTFAFTQTGCIVCCDTKSSHRGWGGAWLSPSAVDLDGPVDETEEGPSDDQAFLTTSTID